MADNINITPGTGDVVAADQVTDGTLGQVKVQIIKVMDGTLDSTNKLVVNSSGQATVTAANLPTTVDTNAGAAGASTLRVAIATGGASFIQTGANVAVTPTLTTSPAYSVGDVMGTGGPLLFAMGASASLLTAVTLASKGGLVTSKQLYIFSANPSGSTVTDNAAFVLASADVNKVIAVLTLTPAVPTGTTSSFATANNIALGIPSGGNLYGVLVEVTSETPGSTTDLSLVFSGA